MRLTSPVRGLTKIRHLRGLPFVMTVAATLNLGQWLYVLIRVRPQVDPIPLHYTTTFGIDRIGPWFVAYLLPLSGTVMLLLNIGLFAALVEQQRVSATLVMLITAVLELMLVGAAILTFRPLS
ncbi:MAG: hypothetical protein HY421_01745 [Candidatus Kerfeldbacteria bacterium]|nr:hypothetical protein [Candidatus Kerfeldbacteria bacterium]